MALIEDEIKELRLLLKNFDEKKVTKEQVMTKVGIYSQIEKRMRLALAAINIVAKYKKEKLDSFLEVGFPQLLGVNVKDRNDEERCVHDLIKGTCSICKKIENNTTIKEDV